MGGPQNHLKFCYFAILLLHALVVVLARYNGAGALRNALHRQARAVDGSGCAGDHSQDGAARVVTLVALEGAGALQNIKWRETNCKIARTALVMQI
jgi:hypothetical protein